MMTKSKKIATCGVLAALAIVFGYVEHLIPFPIGIYGIKLGIANICIIVLMYAVDAKTAIAVNLIRIAVCGILFGNVTSFIYSLVGGSCSFAVMLLLKKADRFSIVGVSVCGGVAHNVAQIIAAVFLFDELRIAFYLPVLLICGTITGELIGMVSIPIIKRLSKK